MVHSHISLPLKTIHLPKLRLRISYLEHCTISIMVGANHKYVMQGILKSINTNKDTKYNTDCDFIMS